MSLRAGEVQSLVCPRCGGALAAEDVNVPLMVALCRGCDATVELIASARTAPPPQLMELATPPRGIRVSESGGELALSRRWYTSAFQTGFLVLWCVVWDGFLVVWYAIGLANFAAGQTEALIMLLFPILHVAAGVGMTYLAAATLVNSSTIRLTASHLEVSHGPLPWGAPAPIPLRAIDQLYLVTVSGKNSRTWNLVARRSDLTSEEVLTGIGDDVQARFLERRIEAHLGIEDHAVAGEYTG